jgi:RNA polymerase sigma factor (TIGR02999 family)
MSDVTRILSQIEEGDSSATDELLPLVYDELRQLSARKLANESPGQTMQATALVHEAYLRLVDVRLAQHWNSRGHFFAAAAEAMRRILIENARRKSSAKRGGGQARRPLDQVEPLVATEDRHQLLELDEALTKLAEADPSAAELVKLRYFAGLTMGQSAQVLGISQRTAYYTWAYARSWLRCAMQAD